MVDNFMHSLRILFGVAFLGVASMLAAGCAIDAATSPASDRSMSQVVTDAEIVLDINKRLLASENQDLFFDVTTNVYEGRVMLTGSVRTARERQRAGALVNGLRGVRTVYNELQVTDAGGFKNTAHDVWISTKIRARLVAARNIKSINFRWQTVNGVVYLIGRAEDRGELDRVLALIKDTEHVTGLIEHVAVDGAGGAATTPRRT
jgi:osmotically-inducible protein OsmY